MTSAVPVLSSGLTENLPWVVGSPYLASKIGAKLVHGGTYKAPQVWYN